jgi:hypothetical protein
LSEKQVYLAFLNQFMGEHLKQGRVDCRVPESRSCLLQRGVPLRQNVRTVSREDVRWNNIMFNRWRALHQGASHDEVSQRFKLCEHSGTP